MPFAMPRSLPFVLSVRVRDFDDEFTVRSQGKSAMAKYCPELRNINVVDRQG